MTEAQRKELIRGARAATSAQAFALRCRIVLACAEPGAFNTHVAAQVGVTGMTRKSPPVQQWLAAHPRFRVHFTPDRVAVARPGRTLVRVSHPTAAAPLGPQKRVKDERRRIGVVGLDQRSYAGDASPAARA
ncbi:hypothetical protein [Nocardia stercoris]|uniref:hypothetical protein n=1 Tax=Nocardia stercoris TaxID=2483361 RepID=UPI0018F72D8D|nr:hypothetical protein [Nocardia stercoris]